MKKYLTPENTQKLLEWLDSKQIKCDGKIFMPEEDCGYDNAIVDTKNKLSSLLSESTQVWEERVCTCRDSDRTWRDIIQKYCRKCEAPIFDPPQSSAKSVGEILEKRLNEIRIGETKTEFDIKLIPITSDLAKKIITQVAEIYANELKP